MMFGITTTRRLRAELADARAETDRQRQRAKTAEGRNAHLTEELAAAREETADGTAAEWRARATAAERRVAHLEKQLDQALGGGDEGIAHSARWKPPRWLPGVPGGAS